MWNYPLINPKTNPKSVLLVHLFYFALFSFPVLEVIIDAPADNTSGMKKVRVSPIPITMSVRLWSILPAAAIIIPVGPRLTQTQKQIF